MSGSRDYCRCARKKAGGGGQALGGGGGGSASEEVDEEEGEGAGGAGAGAPPPSANEREYSSSATSAACGGGYNPRYSSARPYGCRQKGEAAGGAAGDSPSLLAMSASDHILGLAEAGVLPGAARDGRCWYAG